MGKQEEFVLRALEERDVRFVRLWFTDVLGSLKSVAIAPAELEGAFTEGIGFDGSAIEGFARVYEADMLAKPDPSTFQILPWRGEGPSTAKRSSSRSPTGRRKRSSPQCRLSLRQ
jgi:glutamine synthetase